LACAVFWLLSAAFDAVSSCAWQTHTAMKILRIVIQRFGDREWFLNDGKSQTFTAYA
jgi:hypothetical protein